MTPDVLRHLVLVAAVDSRGIKQRQTQRPVVRLVRAVFAVVQDRHAIGPFVTGEVHPLVLWHLELFLVVVASLHRAELGIVSCQWIRDAQRERSLEARFQRAPIHLCVELHAVACPSRRQPDALDNRGILPLAFHLQRHADRARFHDADLRRTGQHRFGRLLPILPIHVPGGPFPGLFVQENQLRGGLEHFPVCFLVQDRSHVTVAVEPHAVPLVLEPVCTAFERGDGGGSAPRAGFINRVPDGRRVGQEKQGGAVARPRRHLGRHGAAVRSEDRDARSGVGRERDGRFPPRPLARWKAD